MIVIVAPYTCNEEGKKVNLGASKKIRFIISVLSKLSGNILLLNTAHNNLETKPLFVRKIEISGIEITEIVLPTTKNSTIGKFLNLFDVSKALELLCKFGKPELFWFYNGYAFEMRFAKTAHSKFSVPMILEFEDWHFSRNRKLSVKTWVDYFFWRVAVTLFTRIYAINSDVKKKVLPYCKEVFLLPGVVPSNLIESMNRSMPFNTSNRKINVGYFGGLSIEKGADLVLDLVNLLPENYILQVTGSGPLKEDFVERSDTSNGQLIYHGMVSDQELIRLIAGCDILLNPHVPIENFKNGIFPFKVIEAISSGRLLISTPVSFDGFEKLEKAVIFVPHSAGAFAEAIKGAAKYYSDNVDIITTITQETRNMFGETYLLDSLQSLVAVNKNTN